MQPFTSVEDERLYRFHKLFAESYVTNLRNLEAPWKPVIASVLDAIIKNVGARRPSIDIAVQQEQPLAPPALSAASTDADRTMTGSKHKGTVYPDVSVLRYLLADPNFRTLSPINMGHEAVDYLVCAELKRSVSRAHIRQGLKDSNKGHTALLTFLRGAARQALRQAFVAIKRPDVANSDLILIAASGPFWMWVLASRASILKKFSTTPMEDLLEEATAERNDDSSREEFNAIGFDENNDIDGSYTPISTALFKTISPGKVFKQDPGLPWSKVVMLDTRESEIELQSIVKALISVVGQK